MSKKVWWIIIIASLGYFVDIYDLILFQIVKKDSLKALGVTGETALFQWETYLFNFQMTGMLIGGLLWGILGDKKGRIKVLFGSIVVYSLANICNAFVTNVETYAFFRLLAGIGLAGELGAGITLVVETMHKDKRGYGTMIIVTFGALGAVVASLVGKEGEHIAQALNLSLHGWQVTYIVGGVMGLLLLALRAGAYESGMYKDMESGKNKRGSFALLFTKQNFPKYFRCILIGLPIWFVVGILIAFSDKFAAYVGITGGVVTIGKSVMFSYIGLSVGDLFSGLFSQFFKTRVKVVTGYIICLALAFIYYIHMSQVTLDMFYFMCFLLGASTGFWALFVTIASEQFGTNIRSTVSNTVPNFVRGATVPMTMGFRKLTDEFGIYPAAITIGVIAISLSLYGILKTDETFSKDLDYLEE